MKFIEQQESIKLFGLENPRDFNIDIKYYDDRFVVKDENTVVCRGIGVTPEFTAEEGFEKYRKTLSKAVTYTQSEEGTLVMLYHWKNKWHLSTLRKLDAFKSYWGGRSSFGSKFIKALHYHVSTGEETVDDTFKRFKNSLDKNCCYHYLVRSNTYSRLVNYPEPTRRLVFLEVSGRDRKSVTSGPEAKNSFNLPVPQMVLNVNNPFEDVCKINYMTRQGLIGIDDKGKRFKIVHPEYVNMLKIRNNVSDLRLRYLELRGDRTSKMFVNFMHLFSEFCYMFAEIEAVILQSAIELLGVYRKRYVQKRYWKVPPIEHTVLKNVHTSNENRVVVFDDIITEVNKLDSTLLLKIYTKHHKILFSNQKYTPANYVYTPFAKNKMTSSTEFVKV